MLQKLSKCEVKAALCGNFAVCLPLRFHVKSNFGEFKWSKMTFLALLEVLNFNFSKFEPFLKSEIYQVSEIVKNGNFCDSNSAKIEWQIDSCIADLNFTF